MIAIADDHIVYIVSNSTPFSTALKAAFNQKGITTCVVGMEEALEKSLGGGLDKPAGIVIVGDHDTPGTSTSAPTELFFNDSPRYEQSKTFLKNAFLLAHRNAAPLMQSMEAFQKKTAQKERSDQTSGEETDTFSETGTFSETDGDSLPFFVTLSFLGGSFGFDDASPITNPLQGALAGLAKTARIEWPGISCRAIDLPPDTSHAVAHADQIASLMLLSPEKQRNVEIGLKDDLCIFPRCVQRKLAESAPTDLFNSHQNQSENFETIGKVPLSSEDVVIVTGGARGVTAACAIALAEAFSPTIVLMGRSPMPEDLPHWMAPLTTEAEIKKGVLTHLFKDAPPPKPMELQALCNKLTAAHEIHQTLEQIQNSGAKVAYRSVDIRNFETVKASIEDIRKTYGPITAIVHGAGVLKDKLIGEKSEAQFMDVFETKVDGMRHLLQSTATDPLKWVLFFSSVAARSGNQGQVDYAMANEVLNKTAQYLSKINPLRNEDEITYTFSPSPFDVSKPKESTLPHDGNRCRYIAINWGPWEGGMVTPQLKRAFLERGIDLISLKDGANAFVSEIVEALDSPDKKEHDANGKKRSYPVEIVIGASLFQEEPSNKPVKALFKRKQLLAFSIGNPSEAFGERYKPFDNDREIARLPGPPYFFMDRITQTDAPQWEMKPAGWIEAEFDLPSDGWYFRAGKTDYVPFCILLEIALQPCGWLAAYAGSALKSDDRLHFRNLGGEAELIRPVHRNMGTLTMRSRMTSVSHAGGLIIQDFDMEVLSGKNPIYKGKTNFGFFTKASLSNQTGIRKSHLMGFDLLNASKKQPETACIKTSPPNPIRFKEDHPITPDDPSVEKKRNGMPSKALRMIDRVDQLIIDGGKYGKGYIEGSKTVDPDEWFFKAHFYQDPVCPGSLGVESFLQLMQFYALSVWQYNPEKYDMIMPQHTHKWIYRGQIVPTNNEIRIAAHIKSITPKNAEDDLNNAIITADGLLYVDGLCIYQMEDFQYQLITQCG